MTIVLRPMENRDAEAVVAIQSEYYVGALIEPAAIIRQRLRAFPDTAWVAEDTRGVCAYLACYLSSMGKLTTLGSEFVRIEPSDTLYLHDLAVARRAEAQGLGSRLAQRALNTARDFGLPFAALVALPSAVPFWARLGFRDSTPKDEYQLAKLNAYGAGARYMVRQIDRQD